MVEPRYVRRQGRTNLDPFAAQLRSWLADNAQQGRKRRRTLKQMHASLRQLGYGGSYGRVCAFAKRWRQEQAEREQTAARGTHSCRCSSRLAKRSSSTGARILQSCGVGFGHH